MPPTFGLKYFRLLIDLGHQNTDHALSFWTGQHCWCCDLKAIWLTLLTCKVALWFCLYCDGCLDKWLSRYSCCFLSLCVFQSGCYVSFDQYFDQRWLSRCPVAIVHYCCQGVQSKGAHLSQDHQRRSLIRFWSPATFFFIYQTLQLNKPLLSDIHASVSQDNMVYASVWILAISKISQLLDHWPTKCVRTKQDRDDEGYLLFLRELWNIYLWVYILYFWILYLYLVDAIFYLYLVDAMLFLIEAYKQSELIINHSFRLLLNRNICTPAESVSSMCICLLILYLACVSACWFYI